ncbi:MAG: AAA family ATPase [Caulobacteraceae bacterium]
MAAPANDNVVRLAPAEPFQLTAEYIVPVEAGEAPFAPPPLDDIFGLGECNEEETIFVDAMPPVFIAQAAVEPEEEIEPSPLAAEDDAPFDPPEFDDEPVFSAPASAQLGRIAAPAPKPEPSKPLAAREAPAPRDRPVPAISIYASWDSAEAETLLRALAADPRLARADIEIARGGIAGAAAYCVTHEAPDLVILDTTLDGAAMLPELDRLRAAAPRTKIVIIGAVNDIALLRDLAARGVSDYIVPPATADALARSLCALFAAAAPARVIAVIGARGGVGASTIAHNVAWSIAERQGARTTLADLDLSFGAAAFNFQQSPAVSVADVIKAEDADETLTRALIKLTPGLQLLCAPDCVESAEIEFDVFERTLAELRRTGAYVVLDLPHVWEPWVRQALRDADEVVIVAAPDLASLRNADNTLKLLRSERDKASTPKVVLSMAGVPKRPEIPLKEFAEALCVQPAMTFAFEPELFGAASANGQMIYEAMPDAKAALQLDTLASLLTGREPVAQPAPRVRVQPVEREDPAPATDATLKVAEPARAPEVLPVLDLVVEVPNETKRARPRRAARTGFIALQEPQPRRSLRSRGLVRAAAAMLALAIATAWDVQQHRAASDEQTRHSIEVNASRA